MTAHDPSLNRRTGRGLLAWLLGDSSAEADAPQATETPGESSLDVSDPRRVAQMQLMADISHFLFTHDLPISPFTLGIAHDYITGNNALISRRIDQRLQARELITIAWLEATARETTGDQAEVLNRLMTRLETNIDAFDRTSNAAKTAANDYNSALSAHVDDLGRTDRDASRADTPSRMVHEIVGLARAMLERTASLEQDMARSMLETRALRRSLEQARRTAEEDHLTGLPNRRAFEHRFSAEFTAAREAGDQLAVAFCDIDNFKRINDEHGHEAGDRVLKNVAESLARISNDRCHVARHGGEEFVILLRGRSIHQAWELLDDARVALAERRMMNRATNQPFGKVTFSGGIADVFSFSDPRTALRAADRALYRAKSEGRNRVLVADPATDLTVRTQRRD